MLADFGQPPGIFVIVPIFIGLIFVIVIGGIIYTIIKGIAQWSYNNGQPILSVPASVVAKRTNTSGGGNMNSMNNVGFNNMNSMNRVSTSYYATFEMADGSRQEFGMSGNNYGLLVEGDRGTLTYQGTRYKGFTRDRTSSVPV